MGTPSRISRFEDLVVWQKALDLARETYRITSQERFTRDWCLKDQIRKASVSILSNIAEGFGKYSNPEFRKYLAIANGSAFEVRAQIHLAREPGYVGTLEAERLISLCEEISKLMAALRVRMK